jgi:hypothetical protein
MSSWGSTIVLGEARFLMVGTWKCMLAAHLSNKICSGSYAVLFTMCMFIYKAGVGELGSEAIELGRGKKGQLG